MTIEISRLRPAGPPADSDTKAALRHEIEGLRLAMESRAAIEQAKGMLMFLYQVGDSAAFAILQRWSKAENLKVRDLAVALIHLTVNGDQPSDVGDPARAAVARALRGS